MAKIKVVWGAPCSGKSTYAKEHMGERDLVYDYDSLVTALTGKQGHRVEKSRAHQLALAIRGLYCKITAEDADIGDAYVLTRRPSGYLQSALSKYQGVEYIHLDTSREECLARLQTDDSREDKEAWAAIINEYFDGKPEEVTVPKNKIEIYLTEEIQPDWEEWNAQSYRWETVESPTSQNHFVNLLGSATAEDEVHLYINSLGGSVKEALGIYQLLRRIPCQVVAHIDGFAASAASIIAMAADRVIMPANTCMMIHNASWWAYGNPAQLRKSAEDLDVINKAAIESYQMHAGERLDAQGLQRMLDAETWLTAQECLALGLADEVIESNGDAGAKYGQAAAKCHKYPAAKLGADVAAKLGALGCTAGGAALTSDSGEAAASSPLQGSEGVPESGTEEDSQPQGGSPENNTGAVFAALKKFMEE